VEEKHPQVCPLGVDRNCTAVSKKLKDRSVIHETVVGTETVTVSTFLTPHLDDASESQVSVPKSMLRLFIDEILLNPLCNYWN
jgi:hypothetical protein